jgi:hypothetical protein
MKRIIVLAISVLFLLAVPLAAIAADMTVDNPKGTPDDGKGTTTTVVVETPDHTQVLGGHSCHALHGLLNAAHHSHRLHVRVVLSAK